MRKKKCVTALLLVLMATMVLSGCGNSAASSGGASDVAASADTDAESAVAVTASADEAESAEKEQSPTADAEKTGTDNVPETAAEEQDGNDCLVVYFSRTGEQYTVGVIEKGNTAIVAEMIAEQTGADMFEILPQEDYYPYTYDALTDIAKQEQNKNARPAYQGTVPDLSNYSTVFIGAPVWWGDWPMIMYTFFEEHADAMAGKTLIPFSTHEGSGLSGFDRKLSAACPDSIVGEGLAIRGNDAQNNQEDVRNSVTSWLSGLEY